MNFFLPESEDRVDPEYDFQTDKYAADRESGKLHDVYAHEIFEEPQYDGILVTKSNISPRVAEMVKDCGGIHNHLRLPKEYPIMGDCGAFQYIAQEKPPYTCEEIFDYYEVLGFDYGFTLDHVIVQFNLEYDRDSSLIPLEPTEDMKSRFKITLDNAQKMMALAKDREPPFRLVGCAQGWSPDTYHDAVRQLIDIGYDYIAIGGVAKAPNASILSILDTIRDTVTQADVKLHMLGVARFDLLDAYARTNVASCDSSASLMQAFKSGKDNYHTPGKNYTAVRIPPVRGDASPKVRKLLKASEKPEELEQKLYTLEQAALDAIRKYADRKLGLKDAMIALVAYEDQFGDSKKYYPLFEETLRDRPWENCPCAICKALGIEVVILRGNNRNRRRGFHNTYVFYRRFKEI
jgi:hypothetical protein